MRIIRNIILHCSATQPNVKVKTILDYWKEVKHWNTVGYHYLIEYDGTVNNLLPVEQVSNGVQGHNFDSINVCYIGGVDTTGKAHDTRSKAQKDALVSLLTELRRSYPNAKIVGHRDMSPDTNRDGTVQPCEWVKECPSFNAKEEYKLI